MSNTQPVLTSSTIVSEQDIPTIQEHLPRNELQDSIYFEQEDYQNSTIEYKDKLKAPSRLPLLTSLNLLPGKFKMLQFWEGIISKIEEKDVESRIKDKTDPSLPDELVVFDLDEFSPDDQLNIKPGSVFYWSIGYADYPGRGRIRESRIRLRRLTGWSKTEINGAISLASDLEKLFEPNNNDSSS